MVKIICSQVGPVSVDCIFQFSNDLEVGAMNRLISILDLSIFGLGLLITCVLQVFIDYKVSCYVLELLLLVALTAFCCFAYYISFIKNDIEPSTRQAIIAIMLVIVYVIVYSLPIFSFFQKKGVNNSVFLCVVLMLISRVLLYTAKIITKNMMSDKKLLMPNYAKEIALRTICNRFKSIGIGFMVICIVMLVVNSITSSLDVSLIPKDLGLYDLWSKVF